MAFATSNSTSSVTPFSPFTSTFTSPRAVPLSHAPPFHISFRRPLPSISAVHAAAEVIAPTTAMAPASFYDILGIQDFASRTEIKAAYRKLARAVHPDAVASNGHRDATSAADEFIRVHEAYATLSDPRKRADYDRMLLCKRRRIAYSPTYAVATCKHASTSYTGFPGYTRRTWETDQCW